jgi:hypothetical protein
MDHEESPEEPAFVFTPLDVWSILSTESALCQRLLDDFQFDLNTHFFVHLVVLARKQIRALTPKISR